jgi:hypothetical protein
MPKLISLLRASAPCAALATCLSGIALALPSPASAFAEYYNCGSIAPNSWCQDTNNHSWAHDVAYWDGANCISMCAKIINFANNDNGTRACYSASYVWTNYEPAYIGPNTYALAANGDTGVSLVIHGWATTDA